MFRNFRNWWFEFISILFYASLSLEDKIIQCKSVRQVLGSACTMKKDVWDSVEEAVVSDLEDVWDNEQETMVDNQLDNQLEKVWGSVQEAVVDDQDKQWKDSRFFHLCLECNVAGKSNENFQVCCGKNDHINFQSGTRQCLCKYVHPLSTCNLGYRDIQLSHHLEYGISVDIAEHHREQEQEKRVWLEMEGQKVDQEQEKMVWMEGQKEVDSVLYKEMKEIEIKFTLFCTKYTKLTTQTRCSSYIATSTLTSKVSN